MPAQQQTQGPKDMKRSWVPPPRPAYPIFIINATDVTTSKVSQLTYTAYHRSHNHRYTYFIGIHGMSTPTSGTLRRQLLGRPPQQYPVHTNPHRYPDEQVT